jgi:hypothetical protein
VKGIRLEPGRSLLESFGADDLTRLAAKVRIGGGSARSQARLAEAILARLDLQDIVEALRDLWPQPPGEGRLDTLDRMTGDATVQVCSPSDPSLGELLLEQGEGCLALCLSDTQVFLENRWPVVLQETGPVAHERLYAAFIGPGQVHPAAEAAPPRNRPFLLDEGSYGIRNARLRLELRRTGQLSFLVTCLRRHPKTRRPEYLLEPIA